MSVDDILLETEEQMQSGFEATQRNFNTIRTGRANASLSRSHRGGLLRCPHSPPKTMASINDPRCQHPDDSAL
jgi:hypothetical protein